VVHPLDWQAFTRHCNCDQQVLAPQALMVAPGPQKTTITLPKADLLNVVSRIRIV
jgi:hypothetical protein